MPHTGSQTQISTWVAPISKGAAMCRLAASLMKPFSCLDQMGLSMGLPLVIWEYLLTLTCRSQSLCALVAIVHRFQMDITYILSSSLISSSPQLRKEFFPPLPWLYFLQSCTDLIEHLYRYTSLFPHQQSPEGRKRRPRLWRMPFLCLRLFVANQ